MASGASAVAGGIGALAAGIGPIGGALIAADFALQLKGAMGDIQHDRDLMAEQLQKPVALNAEAMQDSAASLKTAAANLEQANSGFMGHLGNFFAGGIPAQEAADAKKTAGIREAAGNEIARIRR